MPTIVILGSSWLTQLREQTYVQTRTRPTHRDGAQTGHPHGAPLGALADLRVPKRDRLHGAGMCDENRCFPRCPPKKPATITHEARTTCRPSSDTSTRFPTWMRLRPRDGRASRRPGRPFRRPVFSGLCLLGLGEHWFVLSPPAGPQLRYGAGGPSSRRSRGVRSGVAARSPPSGSGVTPSNSEHMFD
jgi:hypothetical protein